MSTYKVEVTRDDRWWMITVAELNGYVGADGAINLSDTTQARRLSEVSTVARDFICTVTDSAPSEVDLEIVHITVPGIGDAKAAAAHVAELRETARRVEENAAREMEQLAKRATDAGLPVRDVAELLDVSPQRVSQLANQ